MAYSIPSDVDSRPIAIDGAGTLGRRIGSVYAAGGTDVRLFDLSEEQLEGARAEAIEHIDHVRKVLKLDATRTGEVEISADLGQARPCELRRDPSLWSVHAIHSGLCPGRFGKFRG